jgi:hypothetical protein
MTRFDEWRCVATPGRRRWYVVQVSRRPGQVRGLAFVGDSRLRGVHQEFLSQGGSTLPSLTD